MDRDALFEFIHQITSMNMNKCILEVSAVSNVRSGVCVCVCGAGGGGVLVREVLHYCCDSLKT